MRTSSAFLHAELRDGKSLDRRGHAGHSGHRRFDSDIVRARDAAANTHAFSLPGRAVISGSARDGVHQIFAGKLLDGLGALFCQPAVQHFEQPLAHERCVQHAAVEEDVSGLRAADSARRRNFARCLRDRGVGGVRQPHLLQARAPRCCGMSVLRG